MYNYTYEIVEKNAWKFFRLKIGNWLFSVTVIFNFRRPERGVPAFAQIRTHSAPAPPPKDPPQPVTGLQVFKITDNSAKARWQPSSDPTVHMYTCVSMYC